MKIHFILRYVGPVSVRLKIITKIVRSSTAVSVNFRRYYKTMQMSHLTGTIEYFTKNK